MQLTVFAHLHGAKYHFFILGNRVISILEATELMTFREMFSSVLLITRNNK
jgi:hypothetical protein